MEIREKIAGVKEKALAMLEEHSVFGVESQQDRDYLNGSFSFYRNQNSIDLYGATDAVYTLFTLNELSNRSNEKLFSNYCR